VFYSSSLRLSSPDHTAVKDKIGVLSGEDFRRRER